MYIRYAQQVVALAAVAASSLCVYTSWDDDRKRTRRERGRQKERDAFEGIPGWQADYGALAPDHIGDLKRRQAAIAHGIDMDLWKNDYGCFVSEREGDRRRAAALLSANKKER